MAVSDTYSGFFSLDKQCDSFENSFPIKLVLSWFFSSFSFNVVNINEKVTGESMLITDAIKSWEVDFIS